MSLTYNIQSRQNNRNIRMCINNWILNINTTNLKTTCKTPVYLGGPVDCSRGFVLHSGEYILGGKIAKLRGFINGQLFGVDLNCSG